MGLFNRAYRNQLLIFTLGLVFIFPAISVWGQVTVEWLSWDEAVEKSKAEKKKFFVDVYTEWCSWCKKMDKATFQSSHIAEYLNENYYSIKFDAEQRESIFHNDREYKYVRSGRRGYNTLALELTKGRLSYPTIVFLDEEMKVIQPIPGFRGPAEFEMIMTYFAGNHFKIMPWKSYQRTYEPLKKKVNKYSQPVNFKKN